MDKIHSFWHFFPMQGNFNVEEYLKPCQTFMRNLFCVKTSNSILAFKNFTKNLHYRCSAQHLIHLRKQYLKKV